MGITKNRKTQQELLNLADIAFPGKQVTAVTELTEGLFNAAYRFDFADGAASILKIAAASGEGLLSNEINMMQAEVDAMELAHSRSLPYVPQVQYSDFSCTVCDGTFFFMEAMPGKSLNSCKEQLSADTLADIHREIGKLQRRMADIRGKKFGLLADENQFDTLYELVAYLFRHVLEDADRRGVDLGASAEKILSMLEKERQVFDQVRVSSFVHWDMWEGNILVEDGRVTGIIDWERAMWADPLMDDRFRRHTRTGAFLEGYGRTDFTSGEQRRILWYDLFLFTTMYVECFYRQYEDNAGFVNWIQSERKRAWKGLQGEII